MSEALKGPYYDLLTEFARGEFDRPMRGPLDSYRRSLRGAFIALFRAYNAQSEERDLVERHRQVVANVVRDIQRELLDTANWHAETSGAIAAAERALPKGINGYTFVPPRRRNDSER